MLFMFARVVSRTAALTLTVSFSAVVSILAGVSAMAFLAAVCAWFSLYFLGPGSWNNQKL